MAAPEYRIRPFHEPDTGTVVALWEACGLVRPWNDPRADIARKMTVQPELFLVAEGTDGTVVAAGMAGYDGHRGWANYLAVAPALQHAGLGSRLMGTFEQLLLAMGCPKVNLQVRAGNESALAFYGHLGYQADETVSLGRRLIPDR